MRQFTYGSLGQAYKILIELAEEDDGINYHRATSLAAELGEWYAGQASDNVHNKDKFDYFMWRSALCFSIENNLRDKNNLRPNGV